MAAEGRAGRLAVGVFALAAALRLALVALAPGVPASDGRAYHQYALIWLDAGAYQNLDRSPAIRWMPGWPGLLAGLYAVFGREPRVGMLANALLDAGTAALIALLGLRLWDRRTGALAGALYALWPGVAAYAATLFCEPLFGLCLTATLLALAPPGGSPRRDLLAGLAFGACAYVKSEPLALLPGLLFALWRETPAPRAFARRALAFAGLALLLLAPWTLRNYRVFDRFIPTSASGGVVVQLANHPGSRGVQDFARNRELARRYRGDDMAHTTLLRNDAGFREAWRFAREHPGEQLALVARKLRVTYGGDAAALSAIRGAAAEPQVEPARHLRWKRLANAWWFAMLAAAAVGATSWRGWPRGTAPLLFGPLATWWALHAVFLGGERFHVPEAPIYALLAALGLRELARRARAGLPILRREPGTRSEA